MRTFIAIGLPQKIIDTLSKLQLGLKDTGADVKWVEPENIHLTMKFLGEIDEGTKEKVVDIIRKVAAQNPAFTAAISTFGAFPKIDYPRVIWAGLGRGDNESKKIAKEIEQELEKIGIPAEDRAFTSHITLGRVRSSKNRSKLVQELKELESELNPRLAGLEFEVNAISLYKSNLSPKGPVYEVLHAASLKAS